MKALDGKKKTFLGWKGPWNLDSRLVLPSSAHGCLCHPGVLVAQLVWRHSCIVDRLPVVVRFPAGPREVVTRRKVKGADQKKTWTFVSSFLAFVVSSFGWTFEAVSVPSVMSQLQKQVATRSNVWIWRAHSVLPAIKIEIRNSLAMALSKAKSGSAWRSHFWECGTLRATRDTKLLARKWIKGGFYLSSKLSMCLRPRKWDCCSDLFCQKLAQLEQTAALLQVQRNDRIPGRLLIEGLIAPPGAKEHVANLSQSTMLFGIVEVVGAGFHSSAWVRCWFRCDIAGRMSFLRLPWQWIVLSWSGIALLSFLLVSWCVVCFWAPPSPPQTPNAAALRVGLCMSPGVEYHPDIE